MICDVGQHMAQPRFGVNTVELGRADQRVDGGGPLATAVGASEQVVSRPMAMPRSARSAAELWISMMPLSQYRSNSVHRLSTYWIAAAVSDLRDSFSSVARSQL